MTLSDRDIKKALQNKHIRITPQPDLAAQLGSNSLDLRLGNSFRVFEHSKYAYIDPFDTASNAAVTRELMVQENERFIIQPGDFVLGTTIEYVEIPDDMTGRLEGRSSIGRLGIVIHSTAGSIECGFQGKITLEIANMGKMPVALYPGMRICALSFEKLSSPAAVPYYKKKSAKYANQAGPGESRISTEETNIGKSKKVGK